MNYNSLKFFFLLTLYTGAGFSANAQSKKGKEEEEKNSFPQVIQEFMFSQSVYLQDKHEIQQNLVTGHTEKQNEMANRVSYKLEYGILEKFQLSAGYSYDHWNSKGTSYNTGWLQTGAMLGLFSNSRHAASISFDAEFPVRKPNVENVEAEDEPSYSPTLIYARQFGQTQVHLSSGAEIQQKDVNWFYNAAAVYGTGNWHPLLELNAVSEEDFKWYLGTGVVLNGDSGWEFGAGFRHELSHSDWDGFVHLIYEFKFGEQD